MIIDGHSHITLPVEAHIQRMDEAGIDKTVLFSTTFHVERAKNAQEVKENMQFLDDLLTGKKGSMVEARKASIAELKEAVLKYPNRYIGFGAVPIGLGVADTKKYINDYILENQFSGIGEFTFGAGKADLLEPIFEAVNQIKPMPIWIHAFYPLELSDIQKIANFALSYPSIPVILGHLGGFHWMKTMELVEKIPNLYLDTSAYYSTFVLKTIIREIPTKCIFGVDEPFGDLIMAKQEILKYAKTKQEADLILGENIIQILKTTDHIVKK